MMGGVDGSESAHTIERILQGLAVRPKTLRRVFVALKGTVSA